MSRWWAAISGAAESGLVVVPRAELIKGLSETAAQSGLFDGQSSDPRWQWSPIQWANVVEVQHDHCHHLWRV